MLLLRVDQETCPPCPLQPYNALTILKLFSHLPNPSLHKILQLHQLPTSSSLKIGYTDLDSPPPPLPKRPYTRPHLNLVSPYAQRQHQRERKTSRY